MEPVPDNYSTELPDIIKNNYPTQSDVKKYNKELVTRQLPVSNGCLHKFNPNHSPRIGCDNCWFIWFNSNKELVELFHQRYKENKQKLIADYGNKTVKQFTRFMSTILKIQGGEKESRSGNENMQ